ncbi:hypothetical protein Q024_06406 [Pseudomonas aeruginosa BWHPSA011]|nr:hypothetical protein Q024_06406 [Pseudomonas aeruginosa BWHPSA011]ETV28834.1 hypothetical protein Q046_05751 [Pseudomonas aeruginosa BWHPSA041]ETV55895.1 hypothetical protein Q042_05304 [Pseudomonas aeruginosa BWHPSA037]WBJ80083.1 hypothetical protein PALA50_06043 [Pseudomonas aeruginosa]BDF97507.1 hypothetical protein [Pseudomonas aeruginosa]
MSKVLAAFRAVVSRRKAETHSNTSIAGGLYLQCGHSVRVTGWDAYHAEKKRCKKCL